LYAALPTEAQMFAFRPKPKGCTRKIILATYIAETSVTLDGIRFLIDSGKCKSRDYNSATGMASLTVADMQGSGCAENRTRRTYFSRNLLPIVSRACIRGPGGDDNSEISRFDLAQVVLQLKEMGIHDPRTATKAAIFP
jgi:HrpA-like RNA helicase